ncbi:MAG: alpha/beta hydrolase [Burkholderiaceae bacterium]
MKFDVAGRSVYAYTGGKPFDRTLPCIVFIHGALHDHSVWNLLARWFANHGHAVLAIDQPGHGRSPGPPLASVEALADATLALLDAAGLAQAALVGHSMGSLIALEAAARAPERITRLVLLGAAVPMKVSAALLATAAENSLLAIDQVNAFSHSGLAGKPAYPGPGNWLHGGNRALMLKVQAGCEAVNLFAHDFALCDAYAGGLDAVAKVRCASHLVLGSLDQMVPPSASRAVATALNATTVEVPCGHALMQEAPDATLQALRDALR